MITNPYLIPLSNRKLTIFAWLVTILISVLPEIIWAELNQSTPDWLLPAKMGLLALLALAAILWVPLRPLRNFFLIMFAFLGLSELRLRFDFTLPALQALFGSSVFDDRMQAEQTGKLVVSMAMIAILLILGYKRRDLFLRRGDLRAPIQPVPLLGFPRPAPWTQFGLQWGLYIAIALAVVMYLSLRPGSEGMLEVVPILLSITFYAALNAFNEEVTYRIPMLATLEPTGGSRQAMGASAYFFGIAHYFGTPGGIVGGEQSIFMGWILGKAMVETRAFFYDSLDEVI